MKAAARKRIKEYAGTMGVKPEPLYVTLAVRDDGTNFRDHDVHQLPEKFRHKFEGSNAREWFNVKTLDRGQRHQSRQAQKKTFRR